MSESTPATATNTNTTTTAPSTAITPVEPTITRNATATIAVDQEVKPATNASSSSSSSITITLLAISGSRSTFALDASYLQRHMLPVSEPLNMTVYNLKECIWKDWKEDEFDTRPTSAHFIRLIYFGRLLEDRSQLKDCRLQAEAPNVVHMTLKPAESGAEDDTRSGKLASFGGGGGARGERSSPSCRCVIL